VYAFGGALANNVWGTVRATVDADCLVAVPALKYQQLADGLNAMGCAIRGPDRSESPVTVEALLSQVRQRNCMEVFGGGLRAEMFVPVVALQNEILRRAVPVNLENRAVKVTTAEDIILLKMVFHRPKDLIDIGGILVAQCDRLDLDYIRGWSSKVLDDAARDELEALIHTYVSDANEAADD
jgi:hypothetical protein